MTGRRLRANPISSATPSCRNCHRRPSPSPVSIQKDTSEAFGAARFRQGEYRYLKYPLPELLEGLRRVLYSRLVVRLAYGTA